MNKVASETIKLSNRERMVLIGLADCANPEWAYPFQYITNRTGIEPHNTRRVVRSLARKGMMKFYRGLFNDEGEVAGSGYGITDAGFAWIEAEHQPKDAE